MKQSKAERIETDVAIAWVGWGPLLYSKLKELDHFLECVQMDLSSAGLHFSQSGKFLAEQFLAMNERIQAEKGGKT